jgi:hypothetical protein
MYICMVRIVTYYKAPQPTSAAAYSNSTDPMVPIFLLPVLLILSIFNNLILYSYIVLRHFNLAYKLPLQELDYRFTSHSIRYSEKFGYDAKWNSFY